MAGKRKREIVHIDPDKCDGCGLCIPNCAEGAIELIDGKAVLSADNLCDGLGNCLGVCPTDAITIEVREAEAFDEHAVEEHLKDAAPTPAKIAGGCPSAKLRKLRGGQSGAAAPTAGPSPSALQQWPVQLALLPEQSDLWAGAEVLIAADCAAVAMGDFHSRLLAGRTLGIACPKLDDAAAHVEKLTRIFAGNDVAAVTIVRMEVPCCRLDQIVSDALDAAGKADLPLTTVTVGVGGEILDIQGAPVAG